MNRKYTDDQENAIAHRAGNLLILACAGSGKTEVISRRIALLVKEKIPKSSIIAFTFTERAAGELKLRIREHLEKVSPDDPALGDMYVGTIHSFCLQLLKEIDPSYRKYEVMDEARQAALIMTNFHHFPDSSKPALGLNYLRQSTRSGRYWDTISVFLNTLNVLHQKQIPLEAIGDSHLKTAIERYQDIAHDYPNYFFDFNRIIDELISRLKADAAMLRSVQKRFRYLVVDEYQDVDDRQEELIRLISNEGKDVWVTAVGDDDQAIYGWRGARIKNILTFQNRYPEVHTERLTFNFRSTHAIVDVANTAIRKLPPGSRSEKEMVARHWDVGQQSWPETMAENQDIQRRTFPDEQAEAEWIAERVMRLRGTLVTEKDGTQRGIDYADMAILLRSVRTAGHIYATALRAAGVPVVIKGTGGLFDHDEVLLIQAAFCLLARSDLYCLIDGENVRLQEPQIREFIRTKIVNLRDLLKGMPTANEEAFLRWIAKKRDELDERNLEQGQRRHRLSRRIYPQDIFQEMLKELGSADGPGPWPQNVLFNLGRLSDLVTQYEAVHQWVTPKRLGPLCMFLGGWAAGSVDEGRLDEAGTPNAVQILTVHGAKGLEWPVVFLPRVSSGNFPSSRRNQGPETFLDASLFDPKDYAGGDDGERRLWYVALTRCRKFLNISSPKRPGKRPTKYFEEIEHDYVQKSGVIADRANGAAKPPLNVELLPTTYTDLNYFWRCPFEYQLRALMGFNPGVTESYGYGQQIHNILTEIHKRALDGDYLSSDDVAALAKDRFHLRYTKDEPFEMLRGSAQKSLQRFIEKYPEHGKFVLHAEKPFEFVDSTSGALINGTIDLLQKVEELPSGETKLVPVGVVDFKTHGWKKASDFFRVRDEAAAQLQLYAVAVREALHMDAQSAYVHFLVPKPPPNDLKKEGVNEDVKVDITPAKVSEMKSRVQRTVGEIKQSIEKRRFELKGWTTGHCPRCDFKDFCPGYEKWKSTDKITPRPPLREAAREVEIQLIEEEIDAGSESE
jgi:DNA helicase II / ATP-dependent DNA helicase PcrA